MCFPRSSVCDFVFYFAQGTWLTNYVPFEKAYGVHHVIGAIIFGLSLAHGAAHVVNLSLWTGWSFQVDNLFLFADRRSCGFALLGTESHQMSLCSQKII
jgi:hypothetical protein